MDGYGWSLVDGIGFTTLSPYQANKCRILGLEARLLSERDRQLGGREVR